MRSEALIGQRKSSLIGHERTALQISGFIVRRLGGRNLVLRILLRLLVLLMTWRATLSRRLGLICRVRKLSILGLLARGVSQLIVLDLWAYIGKHIVLGL